MESEADAVRHKDLNAAGGFGISGFRGFFHEVGSRSIRGRGEDEDEVTTARTRGPLIRRNGGNMMDGGNMTDGRNMVNGGNMTDGRDMTDREILSHVDHTQLKAFATWEDMIRLCDEAVQYGTASVCVPPCYIKRIRDTYGAGLTICTVVGFPLGYGVTAAKAAEVRQALTDGCDEIDMVVNVSDVKNGLYDQVEEEIRALKKICKDHVLKVIVETCYLTREEKIAMCRAVTAAGADYIKTSTGFGTGGATREDVELFREHIGPGVKIKAAGGVSTREDLEMFLELGCDRIGTSKAVGLLAGKRGED